VRATKDLKYLHIDAGQCPNTGLPRVDVAFENEDVIEYFLAPQIIQRVLDLFPQDDGADIPEAFQVEITWLD